MHGQKGYINHIDSSIILCFFGVAGVDFGDNPLRNALSVIVLPTLQRISGRRLCFICCSSYAEAAVAELVNESDARSPGPALQGCLELLFKRFS